MRSHAISGCPVAGLCRGKPRNKDASLEALHECLEQISWRWPILATWLCLYGHLPICLRGPGPMQRLKLEGPEPQTAWMSQAPHT